MLKPYYETKLGKLYHGDCLEIISEIEADTFITDPVWPNATANIPGKEDPFGLFKNALNLINSRTLRLAIHLGCDSDPRFLAAVPEKWKFFRVVWLRYVRPSYKGRLLMGSDIAYFYGDPPKSKPGQHLIPGYYEDTSSDGKQSEFPCPRKIGHVNYLVHWWSEVEDIIADPFFGSGTTGVCCERLNRRWIGIEIEEKYCEIAAKRIEQELSQRGLREIAPGF